MRISSIEDVAGARTFKSTGSSMASFNRRSSMRRSRNSSYWRRREEGKRRKRRWHHRIPMYSRIISNLVKHFKWKSMTKVHLPLLETLE
jgi:hypothetical protein